MKEWVASSETPSTSSLCGRHRRVLVVFKSDGTLILLTVCNYTSWMTYLDFLDTVTHWHRSDTHQRVRLYIESPLLTFLLLCMANTAPSHDTVLQGASCTQSRCKRSRLMSFEYTTEQCGCKHLHVQDLWAAPHNPAPAAGWRPCRLAERPVYPSHLWREGRFLQKKRSWRVGNAASLFLVYQTASKQQ